jgi:hypothetical protein
MHTPLGICRRDDNLFIVENKESYSYMSL